ncbi:MAG TPA: outer membrane protein assembly factor BamA [Micropepsaceae bacterium]|nr:outer membrane protein assembly factor BamA [Micropepsaceae bacterium]
MKRLALGLLLVVASAFPAYAQTAPDSSTQSQRIVTRIVVEGTQRIEPGTVRSYMPVREGEPVDDALIDRSLKALYATGLFADVTITASGTELLVKVRENPLINRVAFEGNGKISQEDLEKEVQLKPRLIFTRAKVQSDVQRIVELYRRAGNFAVTVEPKIVELDQNRVDLVFEINEGPETGVTRINFIGNRVYDDAELRGEIATTESAWWRFLSSNDNYDPDRLAFDREQLRRFYLRNGYADFRVISSVAELARDNSGFYVTFTVEEGDLYSFGKIDIETNLEEIDKDELMMLILVEEGDEYNAELIDKTIDAVTYAVGVRGYAFAEVNPRVRRNRDTKTIDLIFQIEQGPRVYIDRINIVGNTRTLDRVIRREIRLAEGDAFNRVLIDRSRARIRGLGFFKTVEITEEPGSAPDRTSLTVTVEEQSTGELSVGFGFSSTEGLVGDLSYTERNLLGRGQFLRMRLSLSDRRQQIDLRFTDPYFLDRNFAAGVDLYSTESDFSESSYSTESTGFGLRAGFPLTEFTRLGLRVSGRRDIIEPDPTASDAIRALQGTSYTAQAGFTYSFDTRDDPRTPKTGFIGSFDLDVSSVNVEDIIEVFPCPTTGCTFVEDSYYYYRIEGSIKGYQRLWSDDFIASLAINAGYVDDFASDGGFIDGVRINDRFFKGGSSFRGFENSGVGPRDTASLSQDAVGGQFYAISTFELTFPNYLPEEFGIETAAFVDFGTVGIVDGADTCSAITCIEDDLELRLTVGVSVFWDSPFGRIRLDFSNPVLKADYDITEGFRFSAGTQF